MHKHPLRVLRIRFIRIPIIITVIRTTARSVVGLSMAAQASTSGAGAATVGLTGAAGTGTTGIDRKRVFSVARTYRKRQRFRSDSQCGTIAFAELSYRG